MVDDPEGLVGLLRGGESEGGEKKEDGVGWRDGDGDGDDKPVQLVDEASGEKEGQFAVVYEKWE